MQRLLPPPTEALGSSQLNDAYRCPAPDQWRDGRWLRVNFVMSLDGAIVGSTGVSRTLGTDADRQVFRIAREQCDVVLVGAGTVRAEDYSPSPRPIAIASRQLDLPSTLRIFAERGPEHVRPMVMTTQAAIHAAPAWLHDQAELVACGDVTVRPRSMVDALTTRGLTRILCEGGPALFGDLLREDLVDELLLTISPLLVGATSPDHLVAIPGGLNPPARFTPIQVIEQDGTVLTRLRRH
ncbi:MAG TPA: pyrimidine reductase family protein [Actinobacteria bacterium]|nr:pyrimidine reductase family protein [Actinomycetota bacterium]